MIQIQGYYDGAVCIPLEKGNLRANQKVLITVLEEEIPSPHAGDVGGQGDGGFCGGLGNERR